MKLNHMVSLSDELNSLIIEFEALNKSLSLLPVVEQRINLIRKEQILNSSLFSAKIEGNPITLDKFREDSKSKHFIEIQNIEQSLYFIHQHNNHALDETLVKELHLKTMKNLSGDAGKFRKEQSAIFDQTGKAVYLAPPEFEIRELLEEMFSVFAESKYHPTIKAAILHFQFEKIHPFLDGNGRVGRLLIHQILKNHHLHLNGLLSFENFIEKNKNEYYSLLADESNDLTSLAVFLIQASIHDSEKAVKRMMNWEVSKNDNLAGLLPRRQEIVNIIKDHNMVTFDMLHRRFMAIPISTLRNDLLQLQRKNYVKKLGTTRGVWYALNI